jgi:hypothetical protein
LDNAAKLHERVTSDLERAHSMWRARFCRSQRNNGACRCQASILDGYPFSPKIHVKYESTTFRIKDGLPKFKVFPKAFGGSGLMLEE